MDVITLLIVDDYKLVRKVLTGLINNDPRFKVIGSCATGEEGIRLAMELRPDIVLMDYELPGISGCNATEILTSYQRDIKILGFSSHTHPFFARQMMRKGAMGYITKMASKNELFEALIEVKKGNKYPNVSFELS
jgi:DNA-binding NarL/FixJ family response regulator